MGRLQFPVWTDRAVRLLGPVAAIVPLYLLAVLYLGASPTTTDVGYSPTQPVPFSHALHAGELGMDCRYCHTTVETAAAAAIPPTATCMNCHKNIAVDSRKLLPVRESFASGKPIDWVRVHNLPDFTYFDHSAHVTRGIGCVSCHGRVDHMEQVYQAETLSMAWCLECHRKPQQHVRRIEFVTDMDWVPEESQDELGRRLLEEHNLHPSDDCSTCHR